MRAWYVIHTKARQERLAAEHLARQDFEIYMPLVRLPKRKRGRWHQVVEALFPGYLFVHLDIARQNSASIRSTRGIIGLVRFGNEPKPVPEQLVEHLRALQTDPEGAIRQEHLFESGDQVEIVAGPLAGLRAVFLAPSGEERAHLLLELLGRTNRILVSRHQLVPVS